MPHSDISGSMLVCSSPKLFAAYHVLRRPPMPRHPSCALSSLTTKKLFARSRSPANGTSSLPVSQHKLLASEDCSPDTFLQNFLQDVFFDCQSARAEARVFPLPIQEAKTAFRLMVEPKGLEPSTSCLQSRCSSQLSYGPSSSPLPLKHGGRTWI